jgi:alpha-amylase/alpha-mannosidase (GH57 family)
MVDIALLICLSAPPDRVSPGFHRLVDSNHRPLLKLLADLRMPCAVSIPWGLTERWLSEGYNDCLNLCAEMLRRGEVEFVGTAAYHPILPLLPRPAIERQVVEDQARHRELFPGWACGGFVPPEMAFGPELLPILREAGYQWCAVDDTPYACLSGTPPHQYVPLCADLKVLLRSSMWSRALVNRARDGGSGKALAKDMVSGLRDWMGGDAGYAFLATDSESFGEHRRGSLKVLSEFLGGLVSSGRARLVRPSSLVEVFPARNDEIPPGSWRTTPEQFWEGEFFAPWQSRYNDAHSYLWELTDLAVTAVSKLQQRLDRSLHAGFFWWEENSHWGGAQGAAVAQTGAMRGLRTLLDVVAAAAPEDLDRALELAARLDELT